MKTLFPLNRDGSVTTYLTAGPRVTDFEAPYTLKDQLRFEKEMRDLFYREPAKTPDELFEAREWSYYASNRNPYVDFSTFYFTLKKVCFGIKTVLVADKERSVRVRVWSYAAFDMWLSGKRIATEKVPVYQPIRYTDLTLELTEGENEVAFTVQNFGVRDTRNMLKLQILDTDGIAVTLPVEDSLLADFKAAEEWLLSLKTEGDRILAPTPAPFNAVVKTKDWSQGFWRRSYSDCNGVSSAKVNITVHNKLFSRTFEWIDKIKPRFEKFKTKDKKRELAEKTLRDCSYGSISPAEFYKANGHGSMNAVLCSLYLNGELNEYDEAVIRRSLEYVNTRNDCSDFELSEILYLVLNHKVSESLLEDIKRVALSFRYWMDEEGADAMCFWSENHALTFYGCQAMAGLIWKNERFLRSGRLGSEQCEVGKRRIREWFDTVLTEGFEEFLAGGYMGVTVMAVLKIFDIFGDEFGESARKTLDKIAIESATQCYKGVHVAPMGRIYRGVIEPSKSSVQTILHYIDDENADYVYIRVANLLFSSYQFPEGLGELMKGNIDTVFNSGRAEIHTRKNKDTILTSVASPRASEPPHVDSEDTENYRTKIMNESFHGTSLFVPGKGGYQQHLWYAGISESFLTFVNLPGSERDFSGMRPGYWYGNLVFPYVKQEGRELVCRYLIPDSVPTKFTHAYYPASVADEARATENYRFARVGDSYLALWCSLPLEEYTEESLSNCELRAYGDDVTWYVKVGSRDEDGSFDAFVASCLNETRSIPEM